MENITRYYVDISGNYLGGFCGCMPPDGSIEVYTPPPHGHQKWSFQQNDWAPLSDSVEASIRIQELELTQTPRRLREAALGIDGGWLDNMNNEIEMLRNKL